MTHEPSKRQFLSAGATPLQLLRATAANHRSWFEWNAVRSGGDVHRRAGLWWARSAGPSPGVTIAFPRLTRATVAEALDHVLSDCWGHPHVHEASCWAHDAGHPRELGARLLALGFDWGWMAHWMALDLGRLREGFPAPAGLRIEETEGLAVFDADDLPHYQREEAAHPAPAGTDGMTWHFVAWLDGRPVGHTVVHRSTGRLGAAGIYSMGVSEEFRSRGIGKAVLIAALRHAREIGCHYALLNATSLGETVYRRVGFESLGHGQTWWLQQDGLRQRPPEEQIELAEAAALGDLPSLEKLRARLGVVALDALLPCGMTPLEVAIMLRRNASIRWLIANGATLDVVSAWDLGWKTQVPRLLHERPELVNHRTGRLGLTPLHVAVERNDPELARVILAAGPDLSIPDANWHSTPLGWANHLGRTEIAAMIEGSP